MECRSTNIHTNEIYESLHTIGETASPIGTNHLARDARVGSILLGTQIDKVDPHAEHLHGGSLEMLALLGIALDDTDAVVLQAMLREVFVDLLGELAPETIVERNVDVVRVLQRTRALSSECLESNDH